MRASLVFMSFSAIALALATACGGTVDPGTGGGGNHNTGGNHTGGNNTGGTGGGNYCGGITGITCSASQFCAFPDQICGADDSTGTCVPRPTACDKNIDPVCACDGQVYNNECEAQAAGTDVSNLGGCTPPQGTFACGPKFCAKGQQYCRRDVSDVGSIPDGFTCVSLPAGCGAAPDCACLAGEVCGDMCEATADGGFKLTCPGG